MRVRKVVIDTKDRKLFDYYKGIWDIHLSPEYDLLFMCRDIDTSEEINQYLTKKRLCVRTQELNDGQIRISFPKMPFRLRWELFWRDLKHH